MTRPLKFRAWSHKFQKFLVIGFHIIGETTLFDLLNQHTFEELDTLEIQQFTGLTDSAGKDVYEGDIIEYKLGSGYKYRDLVFYEGAAFVTGPLNRSSANPLNGINAFCEIVGNIFEHPNLLK